MKKRITNVLVAAMMSVSAVAGFVACNDKSANEGDAGSARDVYAMSAVSSMAYLSESGSGGSAAIGFAKAYAAASASVRPEYLSDSDVEGIKNCLSMFDGVIAGGGIEQSVKENTSEDAALSGYKYEMAVSLPEALGGDLLCTLYFNETATNTETEIDDGVEEIEVSTHFEGVALMGEELFVLRGEKEVETEGNETETSIEFKTYKVAADGVSPDLQNYVVVSQEWENDEVGYEYSFYQNGRKVQELELEYEEERGGAEVQFQVKDLASGVKSETEYTIKKATSGNGFFVEFEKNGEKERIAVIQGESGYTFTYANGFEEIV